MHAKKSGEIALTLTVLSFTLMLIGTALGGIQRQQTTTTNAARTGSCYYKAKAKVVIYGTQNFSASQNGGTGLWGIANSKAQTSEFLPSATKSEYTYENENLTFKPAPGAQYSRGELADVFLIGLNRDKWQVIDVHCKNNQTDKSIGCQSNTKLNLDPKGPISITNIKVDCGVDIEYDFEVAPVPPQSGPTPSSKPQQPTQKPVFTATPPPTGGPTSSCIFKPTAYVKLRLADNTEIPLDVKVEQNVTAWRFTNSAKVTSTFTTTGSRTYTSDNLRAVEFCCGIQNDAKGHSAGLTYSVGHAPLINAGDNAKVTLSNYVPLPGKDARYEIVRKIGMDGNPALGGTLDRIEGLKVACDTPAYSYSYGWVLKCTGTDCYRQLPTTTPIFASTAPQPTSINALPITPGATRIPTGNIALPTRSPTFPTRIPTQVLPPNTPTPLPSGYQAQYKTAFCTDKDAYVIGLNALKNSNYGNVKRLFVGGRPGNSNAYTPYRSYIQFDLQNEVFISRKPIIRKVELVLSDTNDSIQSYPEKLQFPTFVKKVQQPWEESTITWNSQPSDGPTVGTQIVNSVRDVTRFNLPASLVQEWVDNPNTNNGLQILGSEDETIEDVPVRAFYSSEEENIPGQTKRTCMTVEYDQGSASTTPKAPAKSPYANRDLNGDKTINVVDFVLTLRMLGTKGFNVAADFNKDGIVNAVDVASVIANFGKKIN